MAGAGATGDAGAAGAADAAAESDGEGLGNVGDETTGSTVGAAAPPDHCNSGVLDQVNGALGISRRGVTPGPAEPAGPSGGSVPAGSTLPGEGNKDTCCGATVSALTSLSIEVADQWSSARGTSAAETRTPDTTEGSATAPTVPATSTLTTTVRAAATG